MGAFTIIIFFICVIYTIWVYKKADKKYMSPQGYDYVVIFKDVDVGDKMLEKNIQEVYKCRKIGKVYRGLTRLLKPDLQQFLAKELQVDPKCIEVLDANPHLSAIRF